MSQGPTLALQPIPAFPIPSLEKLTAPGGPCEGALVILQEDNAGPHTEGNYHAWMTAAFAERQ